MSPVIMYFIRSDNDELVAHVIEPTFIPRADEFIQVTYPPTGKPMRLRVESVSYQYEPKHLAITVKVH